MTGAVRADRPEWRPAGGRRRRDIASVLAVLAFLAVVAAVTYRTARLVNVPGDPDAPGWGLEDFRDAIYYPVVSMREGHNPYDPAPYLTSYPVGDTFPLYLPATLLVYLPLGFFSFVTAEWIYFAATAALTPVIAWLSLAAAGLRTSVASVFSVAALVLLSRPGYWNLFLGQCTALVVVGTYLALEFSRTRPGLAALGVALAMLKPTFGVPLALLLLARRDFRPVVAGGLIAAAASLGPALVVIRNAGGIDPFVHSLVASHAGFGGAVEVDPVTSTYRLDAVALVARLRGTEIPGLEVAVFALIVGIAAVGMARTSDRRLAIPLACLAIVTCTYHQTYDALIVAAPLAIVAAAPVPGLAPARRWLVLGLLLVPCVNWLASTLVIDAGGARTTWWLATVSLNGVALLAAFSVYARLAHRSVG